MKDTKVPFRKYYENGSPKILGYHSKTTGRKIGKWETFYDNGSLKEVGSYKEDKKLADGPFITRMVV